MSYHIKGMLYITQINFNSWYYIIKCDTISYYMILRYDFVIYIIHFIQYCIILYITTSYFIIVYTIIIYYTISYQMAQYNIIVYNSCMIYCNMKSYSTMLFHIMLYIKGIIFPLKSHWVKSNKEGTAWCNSLFTQYFFFIFQR